MVLDTLNASVGRTSTSVVLQQRVKSHIAVMLLLLLLLLCYTRHYVRSAFSYLLMSTTITCSVLETDTGLSLLIAYDRPTRRFSYICMHYSGLGCVNPYSLNIGSCSNKCDVDMLAGKSISISPFTAFGPWPKVRTNKRSDSLKDALQQLA